MKSANDLGFTIMMKVKKDEFLKSHIVDMMEIIAGSVTARDFS